MWEGEWAGLTSGIQVEVGAAEHRDDLEQLCKMLEMPNTYRALMVDDPAHSGDLMTGSVERADPMEANGSLNLEGSTMRE